MTRECVGWSGKCTRPTNVILVLPTGPDQLCQHPLSAGYDRNWVYFNCVMNQKNLVFAWLSRALFAIPSSPSNHRMFFFFFPGLRSEIWNKTTRCHWEIRLMEIVWPACRPGDHVCSSPLLKPSFCNHIFGITIRGTMRLQWLIMVTLR